MSTEWFLPWWIWQPETAGIGDWSYRLFNLFEGVAWLVFGALVLFRWHRNRRSPWEWAYALAFAAFGLTDVREAYAQSLGLVLVKGIVLIWLLLMRRRAMRVWYPGARVF